MIPELEDIIRKRDDTSKLRKRVTQATGVTIGASIVFSLTLLAVKYDIHKIFVNQEGVNQELKAEDERIRSEIYQIETEIPDYDAACVMPKEENLYEVTACSLIGINK